MHLTDYTTVMHWAFWRILFSNILLADRYPVGHETVKVALLLTLIQTHQWCE